LEWEGELNKAAENMLQRATGTTSEAIAQGIIDGFGEGYDEIIDFSSNFEDMIKTALLNAIKASILEGQAMKDFSANFTKAMEDGIIDPNERKKLKEDWDALIQMSLDKAKYYKEITGKDMITPKDLAEEQGGGNLTGAIKGITEETAGLIAGQFMAMRENLLSLRNYTLAIRDYMPGIAESMEYMRNSNSLNYVEFAGMRAATEELSNFAQNQLVAINESVTHLAAIEKNTRDIAKLNSIDSRLEEMNKNLKNL